MSQERVPVMSGTRGTYHHARLGERLEAPWGGIVPSELPRLSHPTRHVRDLAEGTADLLGQVQRRETGRGKGGDVLVRSRLGEPGDGHEAGPDDHVWRQRMRTHHASCGDGKWE